MVGDSWSGISGSGYGTPSVVCRMAVPQRIILDIGHRVTDHIIQVHLYSKGVIDLPLPEEELSLPVAE